MILVLLGESGSGKTTLQKYISDKVNMKPIVSVTTRPKRKGEKNGIDYWFITQDEYNQKLNNKEFIEAAIYNNWCYGVTKNEIADNKTFVSTPHGLRTLKKYIKNNNLENKLKIISVYLKVDRVSRLISLLSRDGEKNIEESIRRNQTDVGQYDGIEDECDIIIDNREYRLSVETIANQISHEINNLKAT